MIKKMDKIAILPLGAYEQHGPHLPFETDFLIADALSNRLQSSLTDRLNLYFLPTETIGYSVEHCLNPQTKSLTYSEAIEHWFKIGEKCHEHGILKLVLFNAHGGNWPILQIVAQELRAKYNMMVVITGVSRFLKNSPLLSEEEKQFDIHAGKIETSIILAIAADKVQMDQAKKFNNLQQSLTQKFKYLRDYGPHAFNWMIEDLNKEGACGDASKASAELGNQLLDYITQEFIILLQEISIFPFPPAQNKE